MPAEGTPTPTTPPTPSLTAVSVADDREVEPLLRRAAADVSALTLRLGAVTRRAAEAERAEAAGPTDDPMLADEADDLGRRLEQERVEHERRLALELAEARAKASDAVATARALAFETVQAADNELDVAEAAVGGSPTPRPIAVPVAVEPQLEVEVVAPVEVEPQVEGEALLDVVLLAEEVPDPPSEAVVDAPIDGVEELPVVTEPPRTSIVERLLHPEALMLVEIAFIVILLLWLR